MSPLRHIAVVHFEIPLGTAVLSLPSLCSLKKACPGIRITAFASGITLSLLKDSPYVDHVCETPNPIKAPLSAFLYALFKIWPNRREYDAIVLNGSNSRILIAVFAILTGIKKRVGYCLRPRLLHSCVEEKDPASIIETNNKAFSLITPAPLEVVEPEIYFSKQDAIVFEDIFAKISTARPRIILVSGTSSGHPNDWYYDRFVQVAKNLIHQHNAFIVLVGAPSDRRQAEMLKEHIGFDTVSLAGKTSPRELAALMAYCDFCISVDTGAMHVARAVSLPTVILGNAAQPRWLWLPPPELNHFELIRKDHLACSICWRHMCPTRECMDEISVHDVLEGFSRLKRRVLWGDRERLKRINRLSNVTS